MHSASVMRICTKENWRKITLEKLPAAREYCDTYIQPEIDQASEEGKYSIRHKIELMTQQKTRVIEEYLVSLGYTYEYEIAPDNLYMIIRW